MDHTDLVDLQRDGGFRARRALERLREGLYDALAVRLLTVHQEVLEAEFDAGLQRLEAGEAAHLCVCGPYGQGKSHSLTYLRERALAQGYAVSAINLDPREAPLHLFPQVYRALLETLTFPAPVSLLEAWQSWVQAQDLPQENRSLALAERLPQDMPHPFKAILVALAQSTQHVPQGMRVLKSYRDYRPTDFPVILHRALMGEAVPVARLRPALKYRQVDFYRQASLALRGDEPFIRMVAALSQLLRLMGYKGWVLFFDEGEAIIQVRSPMRARAYHVLHRLLYPATSQPGFYPIFAFTPEFFQQIREEDYDVPYFDQDYDRAWRHLSVYQLRSLSRQAWQRLSETLIVLHGVAYQWPADRQRLEPLLTARLDRLPLEDTRATLKALVDELDQVQQQDFFASVA